MPSPLDPGSVVDPGPGRLPAGVVPAGALLPPGGGGGGGAFAALQAHIHNPLDAHMAHAIGVDPYVPWNGTPPTPDPILTRVGGPVSGESVLDFIDEFKDLIPPHPNYLGFANGLSPTSGIPNWDTLASVVSVGGTSVTGGYANGVNVVFTRQLAPATTTTVAPSGTLFPADRGVLALYKNTNGNFFDPSHTTLVAAIWLGDLPAPGGIPHPSAGFDENVRKTQQVNYTASNSGIDQISLAFRYPYLESYTNYAPPTVPYGPYPVNFYTYQLATYSIAAQAVVTNDSFLLVHWRESYVAGLASIQPANLTLAKFVLANCYSATPVSGNFSVASVAVSNMAASAGLHSPILVTTSSPLPSLDQAYVSILGVTGTTEANGQWNITVLTPTTFTLNNSRFSNAYTGSGTVYYAPAIAFTNRLNVFVDSSSATSPTAGTSSLSVVGSPTDSTQLSGLAFYSVVSGGGALSWNANLTANHLFSNSFHTGSVDNPPNVPALFSGAPFLDPIQIDFTQFGGAIMPVPYYVMNLSGTPSPLYSATNAPQPADVGQYINATLPIYLPPGGTAKNTSASVGTLPTQRGYSPLVVNLYSAFQETIVNSGAKYLWNSFPQSGGSVEATMTQEYFVDESYRYPLSFNAKGVGPFPIIPSSPFASGTALTGTASPTPPYVTPQQNDAQVIGSAVVYPQVNYSTGFLPVGPNYAAVQSTDSGSNLRRYMRAFDTGLPRNIGVIRVSGVAYSAFQAAQPYNGAETTGHTTGGAIIQILVPGANGTGWLDLGRSYGDPGIAALDFYGCNTSVATGSDVNGPYVDVTYQTTAFTFNNGSGQFPLFVRTTYLNNASALLLSLTSLEWLSPS